MVAVSIDPRSAALSVLDGRKQEEIKILSMLVDRMADEEHGMPYLLQRAMACIVELKELDASIKTILSSGEKVK